MSQSQSTTFSRSQAPSPSPTEVEPDIGSTDDHIDALLSSLLWADPNNEPLLSEPSEHLLLGAITFMCLAYQSGSNIFYTRCHKDLTNAILHQTQNINIVSFRKWLIANSGPLSWSLPMPATASIIRDGVEPAIILMTTRAMSAHRSRGATHPLQRQGAMTESMMRGNSQPIAVLEPPHPQTVPVNPTPTGSG
jgi:hypothetical protein